MTQEEILRMYIKELQRFLTKSEIDKAMINLQKEVQNVWKNDRN